MVALPQVAENDNVGTTAIAGLYFAHIERLLGVLERLTDGGNTVVVIEHNLDKIKSGDWTVDLGAEGGTGGGQIIFIRTSVDVSGNPASFTGHYVKPLLDPGVRAAD